MAKDLTDYIMLRKSEKTFRIKFAFQPKDVDMDRVERHLKKYDVKDIGPISKTIFQKNPVDFADIKNSEIWIFDVVLGFPVTNASLKEELCRIFKTHPKYIVVRGEHDPLLDQADEILEDQEDCEIANSEDEDPKLLNAEYEEFAEYEAAAKDYYGDEYNEDMLKVFAEEKAKLDARYHKYDFPAGEGLFPETAKDSDVKDDAGPTKETVASSPKWRA